MLWDRIEWALVLTTRRFVFVYFSYLSTKTKRHNYKRMWNTIRIRVSEEKCHGLTFPCAKQFTMNYQWNIYYQSKLNRNNTGLSMRPNPLRLPGRYTPARQSSSNSSAPRSNVELSLVKQGLNKPGRRLSCLYNRCIHFDRLQLRLWPAWRSCSGLPATSTLATTIYTTPATLSADIEPIQPSTPQWCCIHDPTPV